MRSETTKANFLGEMNMLEAQITATRRGYITLYLRDDDTNFVDLICKYHFLSETMGNQQIIVGESDIRPMTTRYPSWSPAHLVFGPFFWTWK
jgi:hypothetical protein